MAFTHATPPHLSVVTCHASGPASLWLYLIDGIRPVLGLEAETGVLGIDRSVLAFQSAIQEVSCVKLDARLGGVYFQGPPTYSMVHPAVETSQAEGGRGQEAALGREVGPTEERGQDAGDKTGQKLFTGKA